MSSMIKKLIRNTAIGLSALVIANSTLYRLDQTEQAVVTSFGKPVEVVLNPIATNTADRDSINAQVKKQIQDYVLKENVSMPAVDESGAGLKVKMPWQSVHYFDHRMLEWDGAPEQVPTKDKKYLFVDGTARWHIHNPFIYLATLSGDESRGHGKLDDVVDGIVREQISKRDAIESIRSSNRKMLVTDKELESTVAVDQIYDGREKLVSSITAQVNNQCATYGITVTDFLIKRIVYVDQVKASVESRMIAERNRITQKYLSEGDGEYQKIMGEKNRELQSITSEAYKKAEEIKGKADATATRIYAQTYSLDPEFYSFTKSLEVMRDNAKGATLVLDRDNQLFKYVSGKK